MSISDLYESFNQLRRTPALNFIEPVVIAEASDSISGIYLLRHKVNR